MRVSEIKLGLTKAYERDSSDTFLLIPVWDFIGTMTTEIPQMSAEGDIIADNNEKSFLTINAIDGSIFNKTLGY